MSEIHRGGCLCGAARFEIHGDFNRFFLCHCSRCRRNTGSAHASNLFSDAGRLEWLSGEENVTIFQLPETRFGKAFCSTCGSAMPRSRGEGMGVVVPAGSLETPVALPPNAHIFCGSRANWDTNLEDIVQVEMGPT